MPSYTRFIPPFVPIGGAAGVSAFTLLMLERLRNKQKGPLKASLDDWENEGGCMAARDVSVPERPSIDTDNQCGKPVMRLSLP